MKKIIIVLALILGLTGCVLVNDDLKIDDVKMEEAVKKTLVTDVVNAEGLYPSELYAEGHKILRSEVKEDKFYTYVVATIVGYTYENGVYEEETGMANPMVLVFDKDYNFEEYLSPANGSEYESSLKELFPSDLIDDTEVDYRTDFYQNQIKKYLPVDAVFKINEYQLEVAVKKALVTEIPKKDGMRPAELYAEGHKILRSEVKEGKIYAYVTATIESYSYEGGKYETQEGLAGPMVLLFDETYKFIDCLFPADGGEYESSLKKIFPSDLIDDTKVDYRTDFYQNQIKAYLQ